MFFIYAISLLIVVALLFRRDLGLVGHLSYKGGGVVLGLMTVLFILQATLVLYAPGQTGLQMLLLILTHTAVIGLLLLNRHLPGIWIFVLGLLLNLMVMVVNGGWMPVTPETRHFVHPNRAVELYTRPPSSKNIVLPRSETKLWILSDIIRFKMPWQQTAISVGDALLVLGAAYFIFQTTARKEE